MNLKDKKVLVTGASSGIGQAIAIELSKKGAEIYIHYRKNKSGAEETLKQVEKHSKGLIVAADLTITADVKKLFEEIGSVDILINNAGEAMVGEFNDLELWKSQWENIFMSQVYTTDAFLQTTANGPRKIVNVSSIYGLDEMGSTVMPQYSAAKAAVNSYTCNLARDLAPNVLVNAVAPGWTWTPAWEGTPEDRIEFLKSQMKTNRLVEAEEIAHAVTFILENDSMVGEIIRVDGGAHL